jgi:hypothetical protein
MSMAKKNVIYAAGIEHEPGQFGMFDGPANSIEEILDAMPEASQEGKAVYIFEFDESTMPATERILYKYNWRRVEWERFGSPKANDFIDPMLGNKYEVVMRSKEEFIEEVLGGKADLGKRFNGILLKDIFGGDVNWLKEEGELYLLCIYHYGTLMRVYTDRLRMEDGDDRLLRDLKWVKWAILEGYKNGYFDGLSARLGKRETNKQPEEPKKIERVR